MKTYSWFMMAAFLGSILATIVVNPSGEGFVRGYNVIFTLIITSTIVWGMTLPAVGLLVWRWIRCKDFRKTLKQERPTVMLVVLGVAVPVLNAVIARIKSALEYL